MAALVDAVRPSAPDALPCALILLGYPDQFPFLSGGDSGSSFGSRMRHPRGGPPVPLFLWAQLSRPAAAAFDGCTAVPLTPATGSFLRRGGCPRIGPVIPHAVDTRVFRTDGTVGAGGASKSSLGLGDSLVIGAVGANSRRKRFDLVIRSFALAARRLARRHRSARLLIKTDRAVSLDGIDLHRLAEQEGVSGSVRFITNMMTPANLARLYSAMDIFINLSEWEGFGIPVIEAMACGLPVVTHGIQGPGEILPYRETIAGGSTVREESGTRLLEADPQETAGLLTALAEGPELRNRLGTAGRYEAESVYDVRIVLRKWEQLIAGVEIT